MAIITETSHAGRFLVSEGNKTRSREEITVLTGENLDVGAVLGKVTASGKYLQFDPAATAGEGDAVAGILFDAVDATAADVKGVAIVRDAEVNGGELVYLDGISAPDKTAAIAALAALGIIIR